MASGFAALGTVATQVAASALDPAVLSVNGSGLITLGGTDLLEKTSGSNIAISSKSGTSLYLASPGEYASLGQNNGYMRLNDSSALFGWNSLSLSLSSGLGNITGAPWAFSSSAAALYVGGATERTGGIYTTMVVQIGSTTTPGTVALLLPTALGTAGTVLGTLAFFNGTTPGPRIQGQADGTTNTGKLAFYYETGGAATLGLQLLSTGVLDYRLARVANGGGSTPTLGTIGGSGPTAAAQAGWMQLQIAGTNHWVPVWT
ncbi:MAG TPA: hypothetical protein VFJ24_07140 [Gaiellales bacterium]|nr:hypothetical protein [Gaiellales bacterium]